MGGVEGLERTAVPNERRGPGSALAARKSPLERTTVRNERRGSGAFGGVEAPARTHRGPVELPAVGPRESAAATELAEHGDILTIG